jgi:hypothetical protein
MPVLMLPVPVAIMMKLWVGALVGVAGQEEQTLEVGGPMPLLLCCAAA